MILSRHVERLSGNNPNKRTHLTIIAAGARLRLPELVTPDLMRLE
jgi:hypothetical protein